MAVKRQPLLRKVLLHVGLVPFLLFALFPFSILIISLLGVFINKVAPLE